MRTIPTTFRVWALATALLYVLLLVLWATGLVAGLAVNGYFLVMGGLLLISGSPFGRQRWVVVWGVGTVLLGVGLVILNAMPGPGAVILCSVGSITAFVAMIVGARTRFTIPLLPLPLALDEGVRRKTGLSDQTTEQGPPLQVVLVGIGTKRAKVIRRLRELYSPLGLHEGFSIANQTPAVLQTTTSRREADFVAAQLTELGAQVDVREVADSAT